MINILVTGVGSLLGQGIIKSVKYSSLKYKLFGTDYFANAVGLYWVDKGYILPDILDLNISHREWIEEIINIIDQNRINIVLVGLDFEVPLFAEYKEEIEEATKSKVVVSSPKVVKIGNDKWETVNFLKNNGYCYPESCLPENINEFLMKSDFPLVVKPRFGSTSKNVFKVNNSSELEFAVEKCKLPIIQEHVGNRHNEFTCGSIFYNGEVLSCISLRRVLKDGNTSLAFSEQFPDVDEFIVDITKNLKPFGPTNFQLRLTENGPTVFEINPRFSGTTPLRAMLGVNGVEVVINAVLFDKITRKVEKKEGVVIRYFENQYISWDKYRSYS